MIMKVLDLYAGLGGNRKKWTGVDVTAVETNHAIADIYASMYPDDTVIVADAHEYLVENYSSFDLIWSSPPCQTHSSMRQNLAVRYRKTRPEYPDMKLYQEIIFLKHNFDGLWVVENVRPYYEPLIKPTTELQRHLFWSNFEIYPKMFTDSSLRSAQIDDLQEYLGIDISNYKIPNKRQILRNCVMPELGLYILNCAKLKLNKAIENDEICTQRRLGI